MKRAAIWALLVLLTLAVGVGLARQWQTSALLRIEVERLHEEERGLDRLKADNERLKRERTPAAEVERMRADHAAVARLRLELESLRATPGGR
jgi:hypothetical protein